MDEARTHLLQLQRALVEGLVDHSLGAPTVSAYSDELLRRALGDKHVDNLRNKLSFYLPVLAGSGLLTDDDLRSLGAWNPTMASHLDYLEGLVERLHPWAGRQTHPEVWHDLLALERTHYVASQQRAADVPELVAIARTVDGPSRPGDHRPLQVVCLRSNMIDLWRNQAFDLASACPFGRPQLRAVYAHPEHGRLRQHTFTSATDLALRLCLDP